MQTTSSEESTETSPLVGRPRKGRNMTLLVLAVANLCSWSCVSLLAPFFPIEAEKKGVSKTVIGLIYCCSELVIFLASPIFGKLLTQFSPRFFFIAGLCVFGCCDVMFGWLDLSPPGVPFIAICFAVRIVEALGTGSITTASFAIAGNNFPDKIGTVYGTLEMVIGVGYLIGPAIGGALYELGGYRLPFFVLGGLVFVCGCASCFVLAEQDAGRQETSVLSSLILYRSPLVMFGCSCIFFTLIGTTSFAPVYAQHLAQFNLKQSIIGVLFIISAASFAIGSPFWGWLLDKNYSPLPLMNIGLLSGAVVFLFFGPAPFFTFLTPSLWLTILTSALMGFALGPVMISGMRCIVQGARDLGVVGEGNTYGIIAGVIQSSVSLGTFTGPLLGGALTDKFGFGWTMVFVAGFLLLPIIFFSPFTILRFRAWCRSRAKGQRLYSKLQLAETASENGLLYGSSSPPTEVEVTST